MNNTRSCMIVSLLSLCIAGSAMATSTSCATLINTSKSDFLQMLPTSSTDVYQTLHQCAQDNFCATYVGTAPCLPTLYNYTINAAYYASITARASAPPPSSSSTSATTTSTTTTTTPATSTDNTSANSYENINF